MSNLLTRPILGGIFGSGRYALATVPCVVRGLHAVRFMVIEPGTGAVVSLAESQVTALERARQTIRAAQRAELADARRSSNDPRQVELWPLELQAVRPVLERARPVSRRRREVYSKSMGRCHYCEAPLMLDGLWHVEHMLPRALGGADQIGNLVASCAPCNLAKRDRTAIEFVAMGGRERAT